MGKYKLVSGIYCIRCIPTNKVYVGHSKNIKKRWANHRRKLNRGFHENDHLQNAWNKYGKWEFHFSILEYLPYSLTKEEFEEYETKWMLKYKSHLKEYGYNKCLPGSIHLKNKEENVTKTHYGLNTLICINVNDGRILRIQSNKIVAEALGIAYNKIAPLFNYWRNREGDRVIRSAHGWIIVREEDYDKHFDYISFKKKRKTKLVIKKTWKNYYSKKPRNIIPYKDRKLKRIPIIAINIETGEEMRFASIKDSNSMFLEAKVRKCINNEFGKYKHRGYYFKKDVP